MIGSGVEGFPELSLAGGTVADRDVGHLVVVILRGSIRNVLEPAVEERGLGATHGMQATYREGKGLLYIEPGPLPGEATVLTARLGARKVTGDFKGKRITEVVQALSQQCGLSIHVAPNVPDVPVTFSVSDVPIEEALRQLQLAAKQSVPSLVVNNAGAGFQLQLSQ